MSNLLGHCAMRLHMHIGDSKPELISDIILSGLLSIHPDQCEWFNFTESDSLYCFMGLIFVDEHANAHYSTIIIIIL